MPMTAEVRMLDSGYAREARSLLYNAYRHEPTFAYLFEADRPGYDQRVRATVRELVNQHLLQDQPALGLLLDDRLIPAMYNANAIALHPKVKLQDGPALNISNRHEEMLVLRMFGATRREIAEALPEALVGIKDPLSAVRDRTKRIAQYLAFLPTGRETS